MTGFTPQEIEETYENAKKMRLNEAADVLDAWVDRNPTLDDQTADSFQKSLFSLSFSYFSEDGQPGPELTAIGANSLKELSEWEHEHGFNVVWRTLNQIWLQSPMCEDKEYWEKEADKGRYNEVATAWRDYAKLHGLD